MISKQEIGKELKQKIESGASLDQIADWAYDVFYKNANDIDSNTESILLKLFSMKGGSEYHLTDLQLRMIALEWIYTEDRNLPTKERAGLELMTLLMDNNEIGVIAAWAHENDRTIDLDKEIKDIFYEMSFVGEEPRCEPFDEEEAKAELRFLATMLIYNEEEPLKKYIDLQKKNYQKKVELE